MRLHFAYVPLYRQARRRPPIAMERDYRYGHDQA